MTWRKIMHIDIYIPSVGTQHIQISLFFTVITIITIRVWRKQNDEYHAKCIQATVKSPRSVQVWGASSSRCLSLSRKVNGDMDSAKYQSDSIQATEILCEFVVFPKKGYIFIRDLAPCHNSKSTRTFLECKGIPVLE